MNDDNENRAEQLSIVPQDTFLSTVQPPEANVCPMGGEHESASRFNAFEIYEQRDGKYLSIRVRCCHKCSGLYWTPGSEIEQPS